MNFALHPTRSPNYGVTVQDASGALAADAADVPRMYLGTVEGRPGEIAAGDQKASGAFWSIVVFEDGKTWSSTEMCGGGMVQCLLGGTPGEIRSIRGLARGGGIA